MMTFAKILLRVDNRRNKQKEKEEREKKAGDKYQDRIKKKTQCTNNIICNNNIKCVKGTNQGKPTEFFLCTFITESIPKQYVFMYGDDHQIYTTGTQSKQMFKN